jgi:DNA uptake protein ComE-like DNA-binding protein
MINRIRTWVRAFFGFSRNETNAFIILLPLMFLIVFIVPAYKAIFPYQPQDYTQEKKELDSLITFWVTNEKKDSATSLPIQLFPFNPNTATKDQLISIGFSSHLAARLENYRSKGGKFIIKSDVLKLYGIDTALYTRLYSWIDLPAEKQVKKEENKVTADHRKKGMEKFDLNKADSVQLISIYGVGEKLSARIIKYRSRLGGFISIEQLTEVYGLDTTVVNELKKKSFIEENFRPKSLDVNLATEKELATHPYIKYAVAKAITAYRFQHGPFKSIDDLTNIAIIDDNTFEKIRPYLSLNH